MHGWTVVQFAAVEYCVRNAEKTAERRRVASATPDTEIFKIQNKLRNVLDIKLDCN
jgi:hypothetical protein